MVPITSRKVIHNHLKIIETSQYIYKYQTHPIQSYRVTIFYIFNMYSMHMQKKATGIDSYTTYSRPPKMENTKKNPVDNKNLQFQQTKVGHHFWSVTHFSKTNRENRWIIQQMGLILCHRSFSSL